MSKPNVQQVKFAKLEPYTMPRMEERTIEGSPKTKKLVIFEGENGTESGIWECTPGRFRSKMEQNETMYIYEGQAVLKFDEGGEITIKAGDVLTIPKGSSFVWNIQETVCKVYTDFN